MDNMDYEDFENVKKIALTNWTPYNEPYGEFYIAFDSYGMGRFKVLKKSKDRTSTPFFSFMCREDAETYINDNLQQLHYAFYNIDGCTIETEGAEYYVPTVESFMYVFAQLYFTIGVFTNLDIKNTLREYNFYATQQMVRDTMKIIENGPKFEESLKFVNVDHSGPYTIYSKKEYEQQSEYDSKDCCCAENYSDEV
jgi:hypothetical protein